MSSIEKYSENPFDEIKRVDDQGEHWSARDLQPLLGYSKWQDFESAISRARAAAANTGTNVDSAFVQVTQLMDVGNLGTRERMDYRLTRYACYLIAMNGDPRKPEVAADQAYFAVKTREAEIVQQQIPQTYAEALRAAASAWEAHEIAREQIKELEPRAAGANASEETRDGQPVWDLREAVGARLGTKPVNTYKVLAFIGAVTSSGEGSNRKHFPTSDWEDLLVNDVNKIPSPDGRVYEYPGTLLVRAGKQIEFLDRVESTYASKL